MKTMGETEEFNTLTFEKKLMALKDTQESIQSLSSWCLKQRSHHKKIVSSWLNVLKRVKVEQRLVLFYLANDVIQYSKRKNYEFVESWGLNLQKATPLVRDEKVRTKIVRIFKIWEQRAVYDDEFLSDLTGLLSAGAIKKSDDDAMDFQPQQLVNKIKQCSVLEADTDLRLKYIHENHLELSDADALCANLKDRSNKDDVERELNEGISCVERYTQALQREIVARETLLALLASANQYYSTQRGEVKVVAYAYKNFGARVRALKRKLDELIPTLPPAAPSPPRRDEDVPSPGPDEDLDLPPADNTDDEVAYNIDQTFNTSIAADGSLYNLGLSSFLTSDNPLAMFENDTIDLTGSANKIEVINSRPSEKPDFNINDFLKTFAPPDKNNVTENNSITTTITQKPHDTLPGLDLLTPESTGNPAPPTSFYGTLDSLNDEPEQPYIPDGLSNRQWNSNAWMPAASVTGAGGIPGLTGVPGVGGVAGVGGGPGVGSVPGVGGIPGVGGVGVVPGVGGVLGVFADTPESPPPAPRPLPVPPPVPVPDVYVQELPAADVDHRGLLPPPPPPPVLPILGHMEDVDHRLLPALPQPPPPIRHAAPHQDVDHRNLISLTHQPPAPITSINPTLKIDQDYRVPSMLPSDIVESVDMDLSEDEEQQAMYQSNQNERRNSFNNNKVLVGGDTDMKNTQVKKGLDPRDEGPHSAPVKPMTNPFDNMPTGLKFSMSQNSINPLSVPPPSIRPNVMRPQNPPLVLPPNSIPQNTRPQNTVSQNTLPQIVRPMNPPPMRPIIDYPEINNHSTMPPPPLNNNVAFQKKQFDDDDFDDKPFEDDIRSRGFDSNVRNPSPPSYFEDEFSKESDFIGAGPRPFMNQRFPRNWSPRTNFRPGFSPQFWPRSVPRPANRWTGPRPGPRFW